MLNRVSILIGGIVFLAIAALALYRLFVGIRITVSDVEIGQTTTFLIFVVCAALSLMFLRASTIKS